MRVTAALVFLPLAAALHLGVWALSPISFGASSSGGPGRAQASLGVASPRHNALVRTWRTAPRTAPDPDQPRPAVPSADQPQPSALQPAPALPAAPSLPPVSPATLPAAAPPPPSQLRSPGILPTQPRSDTPSTPPHPADSTDQTVTRPSPAQPRATRPDAAPLADTRPPAGLQKPAPKAKPEPRPKKHNPPAASAPAQSTSGGGAAKAGQTGQAGQEATQSASAATRNALRARWGAKIQRRVHRRLIYPRGATGTGVAQVALTISRSGKLTGLRLTRSSGLAAFDTAALGAVRRAGRFPKAPADLRQPSYSFTLSLSFRP